jgi:hypothetical protein
LEVPVERDNAHEEANERKCGEELIGGWTHCEFSSAKIKRLGVINRGMKTERKARIGTVSNASDESLKPESDISCRGTVRNVDGCLKEMQKGTSAREVFRDRSVVYG